MSNNTERLNNLLQSDSLPTLIMGLPRYADTRLWPTHNRDGSLRGCYAQAMILHDHFLDEMNGLLETAIERARARIDTMEDIVAETYLSAREIDKLGTIGHIIGRDALITLGGMNCLLRVGDETPPALREGAIEHLTLCLLILADVICPI